MSVSAGNVNSSSEEEIPAVEEKMVLDARASAGAAALQAPAFFFGRNGESSEDNTAGSSTAPSETTAEVGKRR